MSDLCELSAVQLRRMIGAKIISPTELLEASVRRIEKYDGAINALPIRDFDVARSQAAAATNSVMKGDRLGPLHGLPTAIKDLSLTKGLRTTFGSRIFADFVPDTDDVMVSLIRASGAVIVGKSNTTEFGAGSNTTNDVFGPTRNPFDLTATSGGSSGGASAALAVDMLPICSGSDTGGSLRVPSAFCGTVAIRPTPGVVPFERRHFAFSPFQVLGPMARNIEDLTLFFDVMASFDGADPMSQTLSDKDEDREIDLSSLRVAFSPDLGFAPTTEMIRNTFSRKIGKLQSTFRVCEEKHPEMDTVVEVNWILRAMQFVSQHREKYAKNKELLGPLVVENYEAGLRLTPEEMCWANFEQMRLHQVMTNFFSKYDVLICPTCTIGPFPVEQLYPTDVAGLEQETYVRWAGLTNGLSVTCNPVVAMPCGVDATGMPFGLQIVGPRNSDRRLLKIAARLEEVFARDKETARPRPSLDAILTQAA